MGLWLAGVIIYHVSLSFTVPLGHTLWVLVGSFIIRYVAVVTRRAFTVQKKGSAFNMKKACTIAGSAARGGAGIQADLKHFRSWVFTVHLLLPHLWRHILKQNKACIHNHWRLLKHSYIQFTLKLASMP